MLRVRAAGDHPHIVVPEITVVRISPTQTRLRFESRGIQSESEATVRINNVLQPPHGHRCVACT